MENSDIAKTKIDENLNSDNLANFITNALENQAKNNQNTAFSDVKEKLLIKFTKYIKEILYRSIKRLLQYSFSSIKLSKVIKETRTLEITSKNYLFIEKSLIFELCMKNFSRILSFSAQKQKKIVFFDLLINLKNNKNRAILCRVFQRKFKLLQTAFFKYKQFVLENRYKFLIIRSGKKRAAITRLYHLILKTKIYGFYCIKAFRKDVKVLTIPVEFGVFLMGSFLQTKVIQGLSKGFCKLKFSYKLSKFLGSKAFKAKFRVFLKKIKATALELYRTSFDLWTFDTQTKYLKFL